MANRTFGWIQNPSSTDKLRDVLGLFVPGCEFHAFMVNDRLPLLKRANLFNTPNLYEDFQKILSSNKPIGYSILKGQGAGGEKRFNAKCSGLAQAAITGQQFREYVVDEDMIRIKKPYTDDWTADGFLRWAVSLGFLDYNYSDDTCSITQLGMSFVQAETEKEKNTILGQAYLSYPPVCRVLGLLSAKGHMTKFEIGSQLGFTDEAGFTSIPQNMWVQAYEESTEEERKIIRRDLEGSSDKYARMICGWLEAIGWVSKRTKTVKETYGVKSYTCDISSAFEITALGELNYRRAIGKSKKARIPKVVYREMLASKPSNADYLRKRRSLILEYLKNHKLRSIDDIKSFLSTKKIDEETETIKDDMKGLVNIGMDIEYDGSCYKLKDNIEKLTPYSNDVVNEITDAVEIKERVRLKLQNVDHKYLTLIDYAFSGRDNDKNFEIYTIDLLVPPR